MIILSLTNMKITFVFVSCIFICATAPKSDFVTDAKEILRLMNNVIYSINYVSDCHDIAYKPNATIEEKRRCIQRVVQANPSKRIKNSLIKNRPSHQRHHHLPSRPKCHRFARLAC